MQIKHRFYLVYPSKTPLVVLAPYGSIHTEFPFLALSFKRFTQREGMGSVGRGQVNANPDPVEDKNCSFRYHVWDKRLNFTTLISFVFHTE